MKPVFWFRRRCAALVVISFALAFFVTARPSEGAEHLAASNGVAGCMSPEMQRELESVIVPDVTIVDATPQAVIEYIEGLLPQSIDTVTRPSIQAFKKRGAGRYSAELHNETVKRVIDNLIRLIGCSYTFADESHFCVRLADSPIDGQSSITSGGQNEVESSVEDIIGFE